LIYTEDNLRNATSTMQCKDQQLRHGEEEYHTALMLYEYDEQIITAHAKIQQLESQGG